MYDWTADVRINLPSRVIQRLDKIETRNTWQQQGSQNLRHLESRTGTQKSLQLSQSWEGHQGAEQDPSRLDPQGTVQIFMEYGVLMCGSRGKGVPSRGQIPNETGKTKTSQGKE